MPKKTEKVIFFSPLLILLIILASSVLPTHAELYEWIGDAGVVHFSDNPASVPAKKRSTAQREKPNQTTPSWVMVAENVTGYIYQSFGFYDENAVRKVSSNEWMIPVIVIVDNSGLKWTNGISLTKEMQRVVCSPRSVRTIESKTVTTPTRQIPARYQRHSSGVVYHESLISGHLLDIFCGVIPESEDNTRINGKSDGEDS